MHRSLILIVAAATAACSALPASAASRSYPIAGFSRLRVTGPYTVRVHTGATASVNARGPQARLDKMLVEKEGDTLVISTERNWSWGGMHWGKEDKVVVDISVPMLTAAALTGSGDVAIDSIRTGSFAASVAGSGELTVAALQAGRLSASVTGSGDLTVSGRAGNADTRVTGSGDLQAAGLTVGALSATVTGSGDIAVGPTRTANARVTGSGDISIAGRPRCITKKTGSGSIRCGG